LCLFCSVLNHQVKKLYAYVSPVYARGLQCFVSKRTPGTAGRSAYRHHALNDLIARRFALAGTPVTKEPNWLFRTDGLKLIPRQSSESCCWNVTVTLLTCPLAGGIERDRVCPKLPRGRCYRQKNLPLFAKEETLRLIGPLFAFQTLGPLKCQLAISLPIWEVSGDGEDGAFLSQKPQRVFVHVQRFNAL